ncbi:MAG: GDSL lipase/esterase [Benjaminiella poitrasii]|nr:MAG: GDSL lipase/esterase [Benjaminiella poitrasii]
MHISCTFRLNLLLGYLLVISKLIEGHRILYHKRQNDNSTHVTSIFAFGDSYTDNGSLTEFYKDPKSNISESSLHPQTTKALKRSSDGPLWIEYLSIIMNDADLYDFARSGATVNNTLIPRGTQDMNTQVQYYLDTSYLASKPKNDSVYFLWSGVNDMNDLFAKYPTNSKKQRDILDGIMTSISSDIDHLYHAGAKYVMLLGLIPLEELPMYHTVSSSTRTRLVNLIEDYNNRLVNVVKSYRRSVIMPYFFDTNGLFKELFTKQQLQFNSEFHCQAATNCGDYIWWDKLHPSTKTHQQIATAIYANLLKLGWQ